MDVNHARGEYLFESGVSNAWGYIGGAYFPGKQLVLDSRSHRNTRLWSNAINAWVSRHRRLEAFLLDESGEPMCDKIVNKAAFSS
jgi:hypothetical protein